MRLPRILHGRRLGKRENIVIGLLFLAGLLFYLYRLSGAAARAGWRINTNGTPNPALKFENRVRISAALSPNDVLAAASASGVGSAAATGGGGATEKVILGQMRNKHDKYMRDIGYKHYSFNAFISNQIGLSRELPDTRHKVCPRNATQEGEQLPSVSVVMCFYNEHRMTLFRSIKSVLMRTPQFLLHEIILVDDFSDYPELEFHLQAELHKTFGYDSNIHYMRNERREGLIRSRVYGAREATGDVLIFLDSHIEVNAQWTEPLLRLIKAENTTVAVPVMDLINQDTFDYTPSPLVRGGFNWGLHYTWINIPSDVLKTEQDFKGPFATPTMAGGLFAINRQYFTHIGEYDMGMDIWGGENLEMSFRVWQCGGAIKIVPCSRVGHIFRRKRPYGTPGGVDSLVPNTLRLAFVWMDDYKQYYLNQLKRNTEYTYGNISERLALRERLKCKDFAWYLKHVYPELRLPDESGGGGGANFLKRKAKDGGAGPAPMPASYQPWHSRKRNYKGDPFMLRIVDTNLCATVAATKLKGFWKRGSPLHLQACSHARNQMWYETDRAEIVLDKLLCLESSASGGVDVFINKCHEMLGDQQWHHSNNGPFYNAAAGMCLRAEALQDGAHLSLDLCSKNDGKNAWERIRVPLGSGGGDTDL